VVMVYDDVVVVVVVVVVVRYGRVGDPMDMPSPMPMAVGVMMMDDGLIDDGECREMAGRTWRKLPRGRGPNTDLSTASL